MNKTRRRARREDVNKEKRSPLSLRTGRREVERHRVVVGSTTHPRNRANQKNEKKGTKTTQGGDGKTHGQTEEPNDPSKEGWEGRSVPHHRSNQTSHLSPPPYTRGNREVWSTQKDKTKKERQRERERTGPHTLCVRFEKARQGCILTRS